MATSSIQNAYEGGTSLLAYQGGAFDVIRVSAIYDLSSAVAIKDITVGLLEGVSIESITSRNISDTLSAVTINPPKSFMADADGQVNLVLWSQRMPASAAINYTIDVVGVS